MLLPELSMVDMLLLAMDTQRSYTLLYAWIRICFFPAMDTDMLLPEIPMVDMLLLATDMEMFLPELTMVDMLLPAMDTDMF